MLRNYQSYWRLLDHHGVLHLARTDMMAGAALCGYPPVGTRLSDEIHGVVPPGGHIGMYRRVCEICNERSAVGGPS